MICSKCNAKLDHEALFCPECGTKQDINFHCSNCGHIVDPNAIFCPECGSKVANEDATITPPLQTQHNQNGRKTLVIILITAVLVIGVAAFFLFTYFKKDPARATDGNITTENSADTKKEATERADIVAAGGETCSLEGMIKKDANGLKLLTWDESVSIYGLDDSGQTVLAEKVNNVYVNDIGLEDGILDTVAANKKVVLSGQIYFIGDSIYIKANKVSDADGNVLMNNQNKNSQVVQTQISYDYIIPYSSTVSLGSGDIAGLSLQEINYAKNEIYARHGRRFKSPELQNYFDEKNWYHGTIDSDSFADSMLSGIEKNNITYLKDIEFGINPAGYQLDTRW